MKDWISNKGKHGPFRQKERTPEQKARRFKAALAIIAIMVINILIPVSRNDDTTAVKDGLATAVEQMDAALDSLIQSAGYTDYSITMHGPASATELRDDTDLLIRLDSARLALTMQTVGLTDGDTARTARAIRDMEEELETCQSRRLTVRYITFTTPDSTSMTFIQTWDGHENAMRNMHRTNTGLTTNN